MTKIATIDGKNFVTDSIRDKWRDAVFPIFNDESAYFSRHIDVRPQDKVLDMGTGSGILAITAAQTAQKVVASDLHDRALRFAQFNARENHVDDKIRFVQSDGWENLDDKFDLILLNPPFSAAPTALKGKFYAQGGILGTDITEKMFQGISEHTQQNSRIQLITISLGKDGTPLVFDLIDKHFLPRDPCVEYTHLYPPQEHERLNYYDRIFGDKHAEWKAEISKFPEIYYMFMTINLDSSAPGFYEQEHASFPEEDFSGSWEARIQRVRCSMNLANS